MVTKTSITAAKARKIYAAVRDRENLLRVERWFAVISEHSSKADSQDVLKDLDQFQAVALVESDCARVLWCQQAAVGRTKHVYRVGGEVVDVYLR